MINTFSLYAEPSSCTDFRSTPFIPFLPSLPRRLRQHRRMQKKHTPSITIETPIKIATTPHGCTCSFSLAKSIFSWINVCFVTAASLGAADPAAAAAPAAVGSTAMAPNIAFRNNKIKLISMALNCSNDSWTSGHRHYLAVRTSNGVCGQKYVLAESWWWRDFPRLQRPPPQLLVSIYVDWTPLLSLETETGERIYFENLWISMRSIENGVSA